MALSVQADIDNASREINSEIPSNLDRFFTIHSFLPFHVICFMKFTSFLLSCQGFLLGGGKITRGDGVLSASLEDPMKLNDV
jgi:hypothetical protein